MKKVAWSVKAVAIVNVGRDMCKLCKITRNRFIMKKSIFDSKSEKGIFKRLKTFWSRYVDIFPQIPVRNVVDYNELLKFDNNPSVRDFLLKTSFDFVVCELDTGIPILIIEFDGLSGGFSREGIFHIENEPKQDKYRKLKMDAKLRLCSQFQIPMIVLSYEEINLLTDSNDLITILDVIIGDAIEKNYHKKNYGEYIKMISEAYEFGGKEAAGMATIEIDTINEIYNPIKKKIRDLTRKFPRWPMQIVFPQEEDGYLKGTFSLKLGLKKIEDSFYSKKLLEFNFKMRNVGVYDSDGLFLFNTIGEYCLARKAEKELGFDGKEWQIRYNKTKWTK